MMETFLDEHDKIIFREMMAHPVLFTHPGPQEIALVGDEDSAVLSEILKHPQLVSIHHIKKTPAQILDPRVHSYTNELLDWITQPHRVLTIDVLINIGPLTLDCLPYYYKILKPNGILVQQSGPLFQVAALKTLAEKCQKVGFGDLQLLHFPHSAAGQKSAVFALKQGTFNPVREKIIFNKNFKTDYYNFDMHKAAVALPEFMRREWVV